MKELDPKAYQQLVKNQAKPSPLFKNCSFAFLIGGTICTIGQLLMEAYGALGMGEKPAGTLTSITLIFASSLLTGLGLFHKIAKVAGAGTLVPITGFSNAMTSPCLEFKTEGYVTGLGVKMFTITGPVLAYGFVASVIYGVILWFIEMF